MKKLKKIFSFLLVCVLLGSLTSCEKAGTELSDLMIIQGIGIDYENKGYKVTVEILNNEQSGSPNGNTSSENKTKIYTMYGESVSEALRLLTTKSGNIPLFAHNRVVVINENLGEKSLKDITDFFVRDYDSRVSQLMCIAKNKTAEEIIRANLLEDSVKSEILENLLEESYMQSIVPRVRIIDAVNFLNNPLLSLCIPSVTIVKNEKYEDYKLTGCALYDSSGKASGFLDIEQSKGIAFLTDTVKSGFITGSLSEGDNATFLINKSKTTYNISTENGTLKYCINVNISCDIDEIGKIHTQLSDEKILKELKNAVRISVAKRIFGALEVLQQQDNGDCVFFCKILELKNNALYKSVEKEWPQIFSSIQTEVNVDVTIRRVGEETLEN